MIFSNEQNFFFPRIQILIFLHEATQDDHIRSQYEFGTDKKKFGCVWSFGYAPASVKRIWLYKTVIFHHIVSSILGENRSWIVSAITCKEL